MKEYPSWWSRRERFAQRFGPVFFPCWYVAPRRTRERWTEMSYLVERDAPLSERIELLQRYGTGPAIIRRIPRE